MSKKLLYNEEPIEFTNLEESLKYRPIQRFLIKCSECNNVVLKLRKNITLPLVCKRCKVKHNSERIDWKKAREKGKMTKLKRYGDENYNNIDLIKKKFNSKTLEEKNEISNTLIKVKDE